MKIFKRIILLMVIVSLNSTILNATEKGIDETLGDPTAILNADIEQLGLELEIEKGNLDKLNTELSGAKIRAKISGSIAVSAAAILAVANAIPYVFPAGGKSCTYWDIFKEVNSSTFAKTTIVIGGTSTVVYLFSADQVKELEEKINNSMREVIDLQEEIAQQKQALTELQSEL